jgi:hypothetical protein
MVSINRRRQIIIHLLCFLYKSFFFGLFTLPQNIQKFYSLAIQNQHEVFVGGCKYSVTFLINHSSCTDSLSIQAIVWVIKPLK